MTERTRTQQELEEAVRTGLVSFDDEGNPYSVSSWSPLNMEAALQGGGVREPEFLERRDGVKLLYPGRRHAFWGPSESYKSWLAIVACKDVVDRGGKALYIDFEDDEVGFVDRTRALGIPDDWLTNGSIRYVHPEEPVVNERSRAKKTLAPAQLDFAALLRSQPALVVLDGVTEAMTLHAWHPYDPMDTAKYQHLLARPWEGAVIEIDHTGKDGKTGQLGSQQKRAGLDGISLEFKPEQNEGRGGHTIVGLYVRKDRHGHVRRHVSSKTEFFGRFHLITAAGEQPEAYIEAPRAHAALFEEDQVEPVSLKTIVLEYVQEHPGEMVSTLKRAKLGRWNDVRSVLEDADFRLEKGPNGSKLVSLNGSRNETD